MRGLKGKAFSHSFEKTERFLTFVRNDRACHSERPAGVEESLRLIERLEMTERFLTFVRNGVATRASASHWQLMLPMPQLVHGCSFLSTKTMRCENVSSE